MIFFSAPIMHVVTWVLLAGVFVRRSQGGSNLSDEELWQLFSEQDDRESLGILFQRYTVLVYGVCLKYLQDRDSAKDAVLQIFEALLTKHQDKEILHFKGWLYVVTKNHCLMQLRSLNQRSKKQEKLMKESMELESGAHLYDEANSMENYLEEGLQKLAPEQQQCVRMFYLQEKSYKVIASETGFPLKKVKSYIQNGKRNLKIYLEKRGRP